MNATGASARDVLLFVFPFVSGMVAIIVAAYAVFRARLTETRYDKEKNEAHLSAIRSSYEERIADLSQRLMATGDRWREMNHLVLDGQRHQPDRVETGVSLDRFFEQFGIDADNIHPDPRLIFVLTPFSDREKETYEAITRVCSRLGFRCVRGDEEFTSGEILPHIVGLIAKSRLVIANISTRNANVYYELGMTHALGKATILISRTLKTIPFDVQSKRVVLYSELADLEASLRDALALLIIEEHEKQPRPR